MFFIFHLLFWSCSSICGILVPYPGMEPRPLALEAQSFNHQENPEEDLFIKEKSS